MFFDFAIQILQGCHNFFSKFRKHTEVFDSKTMIAECTCSAIGLVSLSSSFPSASVIANSLSWVPVISEMMSAFVRQCHRHLFLKIVSLFQKKRAGDLKAQEFKSCIQRPAQHVNIRIFEMIKTQNRGKSLKFCITFQELWKNL